MKKLLSTVLIAALLPLHAALPAVAVPETSVQYGPQDRSTPRGISKDRDLKFATFVVVADNGEEDWKIPGDRLQVWVDVNADAFLTTLSDTSFVEIFFDTNLDRASDYSMKFSNRASDNYAYAVDILSSDGTAVPNCEALIWATGTAYALSFNRNCLKPKSDINISARSTSDGIAFDLLPDRGAWQKFKTGFLAAKSCGSGEKDQKVKYDGKTYVCMKSGSKWSWKDYGPIAAKNARWLTEKAYYLCSLNGKYGVDLEDGGKTLTLDGVGKYIISQKDYECVAKALKMPASVQRRVGFTRALDGMQEARWGKINAFWNYHPDSGMNITFSYN